MTASAGVEVVEVDWATRAAECVEIRRVVFIDEQSVPEEIEIDGLDPACRHFLALADGRAVGTARLKAIAGGVKIQRVAVLREARGTGVGRLLMIAMMKAAPPGSILLDAQTSALSFYEKLGFVAEGEIFMDADIPHRRMRIEKKEDAE